MKEQALNFGEHLQANYIEWLIFPIIIIIGHFIVKITNKYVAHFFDRVDYDRTLEVLIQRTVSVFLWIVVFIVALAKIKQHLFCKKVFQSRC